jgi:Secretion system C-terminal sorting domain
MKIKLLYLFLFAIQIGFSQTANTNLSNGAAFDGEPFIAINPTNSKNIVAAWMGFKLGNNIAIKTRASFDGGNTWSTANTLPHYRTNYTSADVSMAFDKSGLLYISYIDSHQKPDSGGVFVARSSDGGLHWDTPSRAFDVYDVANKFAVDRPWITVDNSNTANAGTLFITTKPAPWIAPPNRNYYKVSTDSGHNWSAIANVDGGTHLIGSAIAAPMAAPAATMDGKFCAIYPSYVSSQNVYPALYLATSSDKGQSFSYTTAYSAAPAVLDTNCKNGYQLIASPVNSNQLLFVSPYGSNGDADIMALHSNNGGQTWSSPVRINDDALGNGKTQDMVWATYNELGNVAVTWRDRRNATVNGFWNAGYDFYYATSTDNGQTFSANKKLSSQFIPFDSILTQNGNDFMSCVYHSDTLYTVWGDNRSGKMNIYFAKTIASSNTNVGITLLDGVEMQLQIFPNPFSDKTTLKFETLLKNAVLTVYNASGEQVKQVKNISGQAFTFNRDNLPNGIYFVQISEDNKILAMDKLVIVD